MVISGRVHIVKLDSETYSLFSQLKAAWGKSSITQVALELAGRYKIEILRASGIRIDIPDDSSEGEHRGS